MSNALFVCLFDFANKFICFPHVSPCLLLIECFCFHVCVCLFCCQYGWSALLMATDHGDVDMVQLLLKNGANVNNKDNVSDDVCLFLFVIGHN